jgi:hypothetical protein
MSMDAMQLATVTPLPAPRVPLSPAPDRGGFARVYDLAAARDLRQLTVPAEALDAVEAAARVYEELQARGMHVRFSLRPDEHVGAVLHDRRTGTSRRLSLDEVVDPSTLLPPDAA